MKIGVYYPGALQQWSAHIVDVGQGTQTEKAIVETSRIFARLGHEVRVYTRCERSWDDVPLLRDVVPNDMECALAQIEWLPLLELDVCWADLWIMDVLRFGSTISCPVA